MPRASAKLPLRQAIALGLIQGPTELLPVSSSAHTSLVPFLAGWSYDELEPSFRKAFEVALHSGAGAALALGLRDGPELAILAAVRRPKIALALSVAPPAAAGLILHGAIERRLGGPRQIAVSLLVGAAAMALADRRPASRTLEGCGPADGLALGLAQAVALIPGVSRSGATLAAARARGFARADARALSWAAALPVILGASALELLRGARGGVPAEHRAALVAGGSAAFVSTLAGARLRRAGGRGLLPCAAYRSLLAVTVLRRLRRAHNRNR